MKKKPTHDYPTKASSAWVRSWKYEQEGGEDSTTKGEQEWLLNWPYGAAGLQQMLSNTSQVLLRVKTEEQALLMGKWKYQHAVVCKNYYA